MRSSGCLRALRIVALVAAMLISSSAVAYWRTSGSGTAPGSTGPRRRSRSAPGTPTAPLYPGGQSDVALTISNPNPFRVHVGSLVARHRRQGTAGFGVDAGHAGCARRRSASPRQTNGGAGWTVPPKVGATNGTLSVDLAGSLTMGTAPPAPVRARTSPSISPRAPDAPRAAMAPRERAREAGARGDSSRCSWSACSRAARWRRGRTGRAGAPGAATASPRRRASTRARRRPPAPRAGRTVTVTWGASTLSNGHAVDGYVVTRYDAGSGLAQTVARRLLGHDRAPPAAPRATCPPGSGSTR